MLEKLLALFGVGAIHKIGMITSVASQVVRTFEQEFAQNNDARNAAFDAIIDLLQKHKDAVNQSPKA